MIKNLWIILLFAGALLAHPPSEIKADYNRTSHLLSITVMHDTKDVNMHHIYEISVTVNKKKRILQSIVWQQDALYQKAVFLITDVNAGDILEITAKCNIYGKKTVKLTIPGEN